MSLLAGSVFGFLALHAFAEEPAGFIGFGGLDGAGEIRVSGFAGFLSQSAEVSPFGCMKAAVIAKNTERPQHGIIDYIHW